MMGKKRFTEQAFLFSSQSFKEARRKLVADSLGQSTDLYEALYENKNEPLRSIGFERYELVALKRHWEAATARAERLSEDEYYAAMRLFARVYRAYVAGIKGTLLDLNLIEARLEGLELLRDTNKHWEENLGKVRKEFLKQEKILSDEMEEIRKAGNGNGSSNC